MLDKRWSGHDMKQYYYTKKYNRYSMSNLFAHHFVMAIRWKYSF